MKVEKELVKVRGRDHERTTIHFEDGRTSVIYRVKTDKGVMKVLPRHSSRIIIAEIESAIKAKSRS